MKIINSKEAAMNSSHWSNPGARLYNAICDSEAALKEAYLSIDNIGKDVSYTKSGCKFPHHSINKNGDLVLNVAGVKAAYSRAKQMGVFKGEIKDHLVRHYKELGIYNDSTMVSDEKINENFNKIESFLGLNIYTESFMDEYVGETVVSHNAKGLLKEMEQIEYYSPDDWRLQSPVTTYNTKKGNCHDQSLFEYTLMKNNGVDCGQIFFIEVKKDSNVGGMTHTLTWYIDNKKYYWFEHAWETQKGIHGPYDTLEELKQDVYKAWEHDRDEGYDAILFSSVSNYIVGMDLDQYVASWELEDPDDDNDKRITESMEWIHNAVNGVFTEKSHRDLKYCYRIGFDKNTGEEVAIQFKLDPDNITSVGDPRQVRGAKTTIYKSGLFSKLDNSDKVTVAAAGNKPMFDKALEKDKSNIKKLGLIDFITGPATVEKIFSKSGSSLKTADLIPLFSNFIEDLVHKNRSNLGNTKLLDWMSSEEFKNIIKSSDVPSEKYTVGEKDKGNTYKTTKLLWDYDLFSSYKYTPVLRGYNLPGKGDDPEAALKYIKNDILVKPTTESTVSDLSDLISSIHNTEYCWGRKIDKFSYMENSITFYDSVGVSLDTIYLDSIYNNFGLIKESVEYIEGVLNDKLYIRFGEIPLDEKSKIHRGDAILGEENGVSVWDSCKANDTYFPVMPVNANEDCIADYFYFMLSSNKPVYLVTGKELDNKGTDGEPLLTNVTVLREITKDYDYLKSFKEYVENMIDDKITSYMEKSHSDLKYCYRIGFDTNTGEQVAIQFELNKDKITQVSSKEAFDDAAKKLSNYTDKVFDDKAALEYVKKNIRKYGHIDFITDKLKVVSIFTKSGKSLSSVVIIPLFSKPVIDQMNITAMGGKFNSSSELIDSDLFKQNIVARCKGVDLKYSLEKYQVGNDGGQNKYKTTKLLWDRDLMLSYKFSPLLRGFNKKGNGDKDAEKFINKNTLNKFKAIKESVNEIIDLFESMIQIESTWGQYRYIVYDESFSDFVFDIQNPPLENLYLDHVLEYDIYLDDELSKTDLYYQESYGSEWLEAKVNSQKMCYSSNNDNVSEKDFETRCRNYYIKEYFDNGWGDNVLNSYMEKSDIDNNIEKKFFITSDDGVDNCCVMVKGYNKPMRARSSMITLKKKDDKWYILTKDIKGVWCVPGGGWNKNEDPKDAAIRELHEEARFNIKNVERHGLLIEYREAKSKVADWVKEHIPDENDWWYGYYSAIFVGIYNGEFKGTVDEHDWEDGFKWKELDKVKSELRKEYRDAIYEYLNEHFSESVFTEADDNDNHPEIENNNQQEENTEEENNNEETPLEDMSDEELLGEPIDDEPEQEESHEEEPKEEPKKEEPKKPLSMPKQTDEAEKDKNGVRRKKLYIAFIEWCKAYNNKNTFGSVFDKDIFHNVYPFVPHDMRYFYRLANPILCVLSGDLTFFQVSELRNLNKNNKKLEEMMIFAATEEDLRVFNNKDKKVYRATENNGEIELGPVLGATFDLYIQNMIDQGDILNGPIENEVKEEEE